MNSNIRRNLAATGAAAVLAGLGVFATLQTSSATVADPPGSPGTQSGSSEQAPMHIPVNICGNSVEVIGIDNPALGNTCTP
ncbi:MAG TPA: chaplin [Nocardioides sp.]|jgi:hypothetical protein|nr:chaplin [Nocardioides sp.]